ncbi:UNVERIFIED_ORG: hypothetical protein QOE_3948 [Clostridioides difficile F501]
MGRRREVRVYVNGGLTADRLLCDAKSGFWQFGILFRRVFTKKPQIAEFHRREIPSTSGSRLPKTRFCIT